MTPEQICLSFLKAVEKAGYIARIRVGAKSFRSILASKDFVWTAPLMSNAPKPYIEYHLYTFNTVNGKMNLQSNDSISSEQCLSQDETATRLLSMIKEIEVYGIKLEEV